jgi:alkylation response protein AidB-like acyl-CoA dehydrogenase
MADTLRSSDYASYRDAAAAILSRHQDVQAVETFGLTDVFADADCSPAYAFLEAQGFAGAVSPALSLLALADPPADGALRLLALPFGAGEHVAVAGLFADATVVADLPGTGLVALDSAAPVLRGGPHADDYLTLFEAPSEGDVLVADAEMQTRRPAVLARIQLGSAAEILGVCERLIADALTHVQARKQFGQSLSNFQAVQHLLAWTATEIHQLRCLFDIAVVSAQGSPPDPLLAETVKAVAGRVLHAAAQACVQVTGAISFTWEYSLNQLHHRGLLLDQIAGSSSQLVEAIGRRARSDGRLAPLFELSDLAPDREKPGALGGLL